MLRRSGLPSATIPNSCIDIHLPDASNGLGMPEVPPYQLADHANVFLSASWRWRNARNVLMVRSNNALNRRVASG